MPMAAGGPEKILSIIQFNSIRLSPLGNSAQEPTRCVVGALEKLIHLLSFKSIFKPN